MGETEYVSLEGVSGGRLTGAMCRTPYGLDRTLRFHRATSAAGDYGSIMAWIDDDGQYRAAFCRWQSVIASVRTGSRSALRQHVKDWWPAMHDASLSPSNERAG